MVGKNICTLEVCLIRQMTPKCPQDARASVVPPPQQQSSLLEGSFAPTIITFDFARILAHLPKHPTFPGRNAGI